ncbi:MAG TPA: ribosome silencing factor [Vicinamibacterales bacterium]
MSTSETLPRASKTGGLPAAVDQAVQAARDKKAIDLQVLDLRALAGFTDFFVICSGKNARQVQAIADAVEDALRKDQVKPAHVEGFARAEWVLLDYFDFVVHVFSSERREFYALERLWGSADRVDLPEEASRPRAVSARE